MNNIDNLVQDYTHPIEVLVQHMKACDKLHVVNYYSENSDSQTIKRSLPKIAQKYTNVHFYTIKVTPASVKTQIMYAGKLICDIYSDDPIELLMQIKLYETSITEVQPVLASEELMSATRKFYPALGEYDTVVSRIFESVPMSSSEKYKKLANIHKLVSDLLLEILELESE